MRPVTLLCIILLLWPLTSRGNPTNEFIETLPTGSINWTKGNLTAKGVYPSRNDTSYVSKNLAQPGQTAHRLAAMNLMEALKALRMDTTRNVSDLIAANGQYGQRLNQMVENAQIVRERRLPNGSAEITLQMPLLGGFLQMMLPEEIKQVESIKSVNGASNGAQELATAPLLEVIPEDEGIYTGLVVDARGIGAKPAMVASIVDESGKEVYGSAFVSREYAVQYGVCEYIRANQASVPNPRVAPKPLTAIGLRTSDHSNCDIVISNTDAAKLRDTSANLSFLKQCRVIIVID